MGGYLRYRSDSIPPRFGCQVSKDSDAAGPLRNALRLSPDNVPLRKHLASTLLSSGRADEAAEVLRDGLARQPESAELKVDLAGTFFKQAKYSHALVIIEDLLRQDDPPAEAHLWHCRLLMRRGEVNSAVAAYKAAIDADPAAADSELAQQLGMRHDETSEVVDGRNGRLGKRRHRNRTRKSNALKRTLPTSAGWNRKSPQRLTGADNIVRPARAILLIAGNILVAARPRR